MFSKNDQERIAAAAAAIGVEPAALLAVARVESGGVPYALIEGRKEPLIRFEGHYFDRRLTGEKQALARQAGLSDPKAGAVANPASQAARWGLLTRAAAIDRKAAYESTSWGIGQVMGAHWAWLGYENVNALVAEARGGLAGQTRLMTRFIDKSGLATCLRARDWTAFARGYNGPAFARNRYDSRLRKAYLDYGKPDAVSSAASMQILRHGSRGTAVSTLQADLDALGYATRADGIFGPLTRASVVAFQRDQGLAADGVAGPRTWEALQSAHATSGFWGWLAVLLGALKRLFG